MHLSSSSSSNYYSQSDISLEQPQRQQQSQPRAQSLRQDLLFLNDESNVVIPHRQTDDGNDTPLSLEERLRYLELKFNAYTNFGVRDPFFGSTLQPTSCRNASRLDEFGCQLGWEGVGPHALERKCPGLFDQVICLDDLPKASSSSSSSIKAPSLLWRNSMNDSSSASNHSLMQENEPPTPQQNTSTTTTASLPAPCLVYDFGIRAQPQFGVVLARSFGCEVHAFDPSPVSKNWWETHREAQNLRQELDGRYFFHPYGAGGVDGTIHLNEYDWGQVSILKFPTLLVNCTSSPSSSCQYITGAKPQGIYALPVKTLSTIRKELGHESRTLDILKLDVEGSEFAFLENMLDVTGGCPSFINQLTLEWHHFGWDVRYGEGSSPPINALVTLLHACGLHMFHIHSRGGWPSADLMYHRMQLKDIRYNLAAFHREK